MDLINVLILSAAGVAAGFINTVAGGGSLITLPLLIFLGLPSSVANATNRIAIVFQNIFSVYGFHSKGLRIEKANYWLIISAVFGALLGSYLATIVSNEFLNKFISIAIVLASGVLVLKKEDSSNSEIFYTKKRLIISTIIMFFVGIYGGFIQAGVGFLMLAVLVPYLGNKISKANYIKVFTALSYTIGAVVVFIFNDLISWKHGLVLAFGNALGGYLASTYSVKKGDKWAKRVIFVALIFMAVKLWFY